MPQKLGVPQKYHKTITMSNPKSLYEEVYKITQLFIKKTYLKSQKFAVQYIKEIYE